MNYSIDEGNLYKLGWLAGKGVEERGCSFLILRADFSG
jgi:hypothetical protein